MLLILTSLEDATADYLAHRLEVESVDFLRLNTDSLIDQAKIRFEIGNPVLTIDGVSLSPADVSNVWYRRPESLESNQFEETPEGRFAISEWSEALEGFLSHIPQTKWVNHPSANFAASHKLEQLTTASRLGFDVPRTLLTQDADDLREFFSNCDGQVIAKPLSHGLIERAGAAQSSLIYSSQLTESDLDLLDDLNLCPTLFQEYISKSADYRITVVDGDIHTARLIAQAEDGVQRCDIRRNNMIDVETESFQLPEHIEGLISCLMQQYGLRFGAIDMATSQNGQWYFFEINPNGQWAWLDLTSDLDIASSFVKSFRPEVS